MELGDEILPSYTEIVAPAHDPDERISWWAD
jgi:hypothetical protein